MALLELSSCRCSDGYKPLTVTADTAIEIIDHDFVVNILYRARIYLLRESSQIFIGSDDPTTENFNMNSSVLNRIARFAVRMLILFRINLWTFSRFLNRTIYVNRRLLRLCQGLWSSSLGGSGKYTYCLFYSFARTLYYQHSESRLEFSV